MIYYATRETMQRFKLKTPEKMTPPISLVAQAVKQKEAGQRIYEWGCKVFDFDRRTCMQIISPIREDDIYGGYRVMLNAKFDTLLTPLSIDISTGDAITPHAVKYNFSEIFDDEKSYELWAYNIETVMAEKVETILRRGVFNTRPRDFYDAYILATTQKFDKAVFTEALAATAKHRGTAEQITDVNGILQNIEENPELKAMWEKYRKQFAYAENIEYEKIIELLKTLVE